LWWFVARRAGSLDQYPAQVQVGAAARCQQTSTGRGELRQAIRHGRLSPHHLRPFVVIRCVGSSFRFSRRTWLPTWLGLKEKERKSIYIALFWPRWCTQSAQARITQFYLQITPCLPFLCERSPDVTTTATEAADIQLQLTTHLSTPKG